MGLSDGEIRQRASDRSLAKIIASDLAAAINKDPLDRWNDLPESASLGRPLLRRLNQGQGRGVAR